MHCRTLVAGGGIGAALLVVVALAAKLARSHESLRWIAGVIDVVFRPLLVVTERLFGQSPVAAVGLLALLCLALGIGLAYFARWVFGRR